MKIEKFKKINSQRKKLEYKNIKLYVENKPVMFQAKVTRD